MWIVRLALNRPYTFVVLALLILGIGPITIARTPTDIFPNINIPVVAVLWNYSGLSAQDMAERIISNFERVADDHRQRHRARRIAVAARDRGGQDFLPAGGADRIAPSRRSPPSPRPCCASCRPAPRRRFILTYNASSVPILQLALSGQGLSEQQLFDLGVNFIRPQLATVQGAAIPYPYGGKQRQVQVDLDPAALQAQGLSPADVVNAIAQQNLILPAGHVEDRVVSNTTSTSTPARETVDELNDLPIKTAGGTPIYMRDVAHVRDGYPPQTNIVRVDGQRAALMAVQKTGNASTLDVINEVKAAAARMLPRACRRAPGQAAGRPIGVRPRRDRRRAARSDHRRLPHRADDPASFSAAGAAR